MRNCFHIMNQTLHTVSQSGIPYDMQTIDISSQIRARRAALRLTQQQLADSAGVSRRTIVALEDPDTQSGQLSSLDKVAKAMGCRVTLEPAQ